MPLSLPCSTVRTCSAPRNNTPSEGLPQKEDGVTIGRRTGTPRIEAVERDVARKLAMQPGQVGSVVVDHRAADSQQTVAGVEKLHEPRLARPVHQLARRHLPQPMTPRPPRPRSDPVP